MSDEFFAIYASQAGHFICTEKTQSDILKMAYNKECTSTEIAEKMLLRPVAVNAIVKKLVADGVLEASVDKRDSRRMLYRAAAFPLIEYTDNRQATMTSDEILEELFKNDHPVNWVLHRAFYAFLKEIGANIKPMIWSIGWFFGKKAADASAADDFIGLTDTLVDRFESFGLGDLSVTITYFIRVEVTGFGDNKEREEGVYDDFCMAFIQRAFECCSGKMMYAVKDEGVPDCLSFDLYFKEDQTSISYNPMILPDMDKVDPETVRFAMYEVDGHARMMNDPFMLDIMEQFESGPKSIKDIAVALDKSQSTVSGYLHDMKDRGFIKSVVSSDTRKNVFAQNGIKFINGIDPHPEMLQALEAIVGSVTSGETEYNKGFALTEGVVPALFGIDMNPFASNIGRKIGEKVADKCKPNDFTGVFEQLTELFDSKMESEFTVQLTFYTKAKIVRKVKGDFNDVLLMQMMEMVKGALVRNSGMGMEIRNVDRSVDDEISFEVHFVE